MESGERSAIEVLSKIIDLSGGVGKGLINISAKTISAYVKNKNSVVAGENDIKLLRNCGEQLSVNKIDSGSVERIKEACKEFAIPIAIVEDKGENFLFYKKSDGKLVQMIMERILLENLNKNQDYVVPENLDMKKDMEVPKRIEAKEQLLLMDKKNTVELNPKDLSVMVYDKKKIVAGKQDYSKLSKSKEPVCVIKIDKKYSEKFESISKEFKIPMTIIKNNDNHFMVLKEKDLGKFEMIAHKVLSNELKNEKGLVEDKGAEPKLLTDNDKSRNVNPDNNIRNKVKEAEARLNTPSVEKTIDIVKELPIAKPVER